jgi:hypothetical protein
VEYGWLANEWVTVSRPGQQPLLLAEAQDFLR